MSLFNLNFVWDDFQYPDMAKTMGEFSLDIKGGEFTDSEIMVMLGENGELPVRFWTLNRRKLMRFKVFLSLFVFFQARGRRPSSGCWPEDSNLTEEVCFFVFFPLTQTVTSAEPNTDSPCLSGEVPILNVSYKPQTISPKFKVKDPSGQNKTSTV